jgi:thiol:disulfide interchange protein DsbD
MSTFLRLLTLLLLTLSASAAPGSAQTGFDPERDIRVEAFLSHDAVAPGSSPEVVIVYHVPEGYHITDKSYGMFYAEADTTDRLRLDRITLPKGIPYHEEEIYRGNVLVRGSLTVSGEGAGSEDLTIYAGYQVCSEFGDLTCYMPVDKELVLPVRFVEKATEMKPVNAEWFGTPEAPAASSSGEGLEGKLQSALEAGSWVAFFIVFLGGILSSLTPCVYPVIPITISFIGARSKGKFHGFIQSLYFVMGMALVYSGLGMAAALGGGSFGAVGQSSAVQAVIAVIFLVFAASMFGAFEIQLPSSISAKLQEGDKSGPLGAIVMGAITGFIAAPCVGPIIAVLLVYIATTGSLAMGFFLMLAYALGMGLLFLVIGTFAGAMNALPGAGGWMDTVKKFFGVVMVAMAVYFLRDTIPGAWMPWIAGGGLVVFAVFSGAFSLLSEESEFADKFYKAVGLIALIIGIRVLLFGFGPMVGTTAGTASLVVSAHPELEWQVSSPDQDIHDALLSEARSSGQPVIVDFWATWCAQCRELDHKTWTDPAVYEEGQRFTRIKMDMTKSDTDWALAQNENFSVVGMPTVIFYDSHGNEQRRFVGFQEAGKVHEWMRGVR